MTSIALLTVDCLRSDHLGCYGYDRPTSPNIDAFADSATLYSNAYSNCPGTRWAFQSLHTGASTTRFNELGIPDDYQPLASYLKAVGYRTGGFVNNGWVSRDFNYHRGFDTYYSVRETSESDPLPVQIGKRVMRTLDSELVTENILRPIRESLRRFETTDEGYYKEPHTDEQTVDHALDFIGKHEAAGEDYFLWLHFMDAHTPYTHWPEHREVICGTGEGHTKHPGEDDLVHKGREPDQLAIDTYDSCIREVDKQIGRVLNAVGPETAVLMTGDHGEEFGMYGEFHEASLYSSMTEVPIIANIPGLDEGIVEVPATHLDISATILSIAGLDIPDHWEGSPLTDHEARRGRPVFFSLGRDEVALQTEQWKYMRKGETEELYQIEHGEEEANTEEVSDDRPAVLERFRGSCDERLGDMTTTRESKQIEGEDMSEAVEQNLEDLGYL